MSAVGADRMVGATLAPWEHARANLVHAEFHGSARSEIHLAVYRFRHGHRDDDDDRRVSKKRAIAGAEGTECELDVDRYLKT